MFEDPDVISCSCKTPRQRFQEKIEKVPFHECWEWTGHINNLGYGNFRFAGKAQIASRVAWMMEYGPITSDLEVCHRCDNPSCVRPEHLFLGTHKENMKDRENKGRGVAKLTIEQVRKIRELIAAGERPIDIARMFGVTKHNIYRIDRKDSWKEE